MISPSPDKPKGNNKSPEFQPEFQKVQHEFAAHIRDPKINPAPKDIEDRRMGIYRELFFNNVASFIVSSFPVLHSILDDDHWEAMVRDYFSHHKAETPYFYEMAQEFLTYLKAERDDPNDPAFMLELAHYEWVELALSISDEEINMEGIDADGDLLTGTPVISPLAWPLSYRYDVQHISPDYIPDTPLKQPTHIVVYRNSNDDVGFLELNPVTARLLYLFPEGSQLSGQQALEQIAREMQHPDPAVVIKGGMEALQELKRRDIILGTRK
ncbi:MAG: DUF2063 domain-containing protein [Gammaproteobacteria bacterium]|nr:MAG: DUF2063 domain-containing protein [Gammaproteobacteria bacterium]